MDKLRRTLIGIFVLVVMMLAVDNNTHVVNVFDFPMFKYIKEKSLYYTGSENIVTAVYLNYRYFDTVIEAFVLMFATIAVTNMNKHKNVEDGSNEK